MAQHEHTYPYTLCTLALEISRWSNAARFEPSNSREEGRGRRDGTQGRTPGGAAGRVRPANESSSNRARIAASWGETGRGELGDFYFGNRPKSPGSKSSPPRELSELGAKLTRLNEVQTSPLRAAVRSFEQLARELLARRSLDRERPSNEREALSETCPSAFAPLPVTVTSRTLSGENDSGVNNARRERCGCEAARARRTAPDYGWRFKLAAPNPSRRASVYIPYIRYGVALGRTDWVMNFAAAADKSTSGFITDSRLSLDLQLGERKLETRDERETCQAR
jgi:hypothetical protein